MISVVNACATLDRIDDETPDRMIRELASIRGRDQDQENHHEGKEPKATQRRTGRDRLVERARVGTQDQCLHR